MSRETILLTGSSGTLGTAIRLEAEKRGLPLLVPTHQEFDITDFKLCCDFTSQQHISVIIHSAAMIDLEKCHLKPQEAFRINTFGTLNMVRVAREQQAQLIAISTYAVFPGEKVDGYNESDTALPINIYGMTKLMAELLVTQTLPASSLIARLGWLFGPVPEKDTKFVGAIIRQAMGRNTPIRAVADKIASPTYARDVAATLLNYVDNQSTGVRHVANRGAASRFDVALKVAELWDLRAAVQSVSSQAFPSPVLRPNFGAITSNYDDSQLISWQEALIRYHDSFPNTADFIARQVVAA